MNNRPVTPAYIVFYILFLPDTWQVVIGLIASGLISPIIMPSDFNSISKAMAFIMVATIGYAASRPLGKWIANSFKKLILRGKAP